MSKELRENLEDLREKVSTLGNWGNKVSSLITTLSAIISLVSICNKAYRGEPKSIKDKLIEKISEEAEQKGAAKKEVEIFEKELEKNKKFTEECKNESQQLDIILTFSEIDNEDRKINKVINYQEWLKSYEVKKKLHEISERREKCKDCGHCGNITKFTKLKQD